VLRLEEWLADGRRIPSWIAGKWVEPPGAQRLAVSEPATGRTIAEVAYGGDDEAVAAADAAASAFPMWAEQSPRARADVLCRAAELLVSRAPAIGRVLAAETGKRLPEAVGEVRFAAEYLRWFAEEARRPQGAVLSGEDPKRRHFTFSRPVGVAVCLSPWNFPVSIQARKLAPALAAGCSVVCRGSDKAPLAVLELFSALEDAGLPAGVANAVHGSAASQVSTLLAHSAVRVVSFTGSTTVGSQVMALASQRIVRCSLELGGSAPFIVFADADLDVAVRDLLVAKLRNNGQSCVAANRVLVEHSVFDEFCQLLAAASSELVVGDPLTDPVPDVGPLIDDARVEAVESLVDEALEQGASWLGVSPSLPVVGTFTRPGFLRDVPVESAMSRSEVFAPVAGIFQFGNEDEAVAQANDTELGLAAYVYTRDLSRAWRMAERLEAGIVGLNHPVPSVAFAPMGGVKQSGFGREGARLGLEEFLDTRYLSVGIDD
jgi:succinate-semialdehyde dehydrogenase/glutarate-semialdehyde dehydrogenase